MNLEKRNKHYLVSITIALGAIVMLLLSPSCSENKKDMAVPVVERDSLPSMTTIGVSSLISDSGVIKYKIIAEEWKVFDRTNPPRWAFEKGLYLEKYDDSMHIDSKIKADTVYYYDKQKLWDLRGNVSIMNIKGEKFYSPQFFWNENTEQVYSDKYICIEQKEKIITGYGFNSNQQFTDYVIHNTAGIFPVEDKQPNDTLRRDTIN